MSINAVLMMTVLAAFAAILFGCHFFIYFSLIKFLGIGNAGAKIWLAGILFFLSISFIASSILAHYSENSATRILYFSSGLWLGIGLNLVLAFAAVWIATAIASVSGFQLEYREYVYLVAFSIVFAISYSGYGVWNAYHPKIKNITVRMDNLPESWRGKTAVQLSDVHLGLIFGKNFLADVVQKVNAEKPDAVFITGDLFDGMDGSLEKLVTPLNDIEAVGGVYFVTGNHETYLGVAGTLDVLKKTPVKVLDDEMADVYGMQVIGVSYPQRGESRDIGGAIRGIKGFDPKKPSILLYHNPAEWRQAKASGVNLQLAGHTHTGQLFPLQYITRLVYGKYFYGLNTDGKFSIYTSPGVGTWGPTMRTNYGPEIVMIRFE